MVTSLAATTTRAVRCVSLTLTLALALAMACTQATLEDPDMLPERDFAYFRCQVQPVLVKRCAFVACHGSEERPFRVYASNRLRLESGSAITEAETRANFDNARGFIGADDASSTGASLLRLKGLDISAGGYFHRGAEIYGGGDVFRSSNDPEFTVLNAWARGEARDDSGCTPDEKLGE